MIMPSRRLCLQLEQIKKYVLNMGLSFRNRQVIFLSSSLSCRVLISPPSFHLHHNSADLLLELEWRTVQWWVGVLCPRWLAYGTHPQAFKVGSKHSGKDNQGQHPNTMEMGTYLFYLFLRFVNAFTWINIPIPAFPTGKEQTAIFFPNHLLKGGFYLNLLCICLLFNWMSWLLEWKPLTFSEPLQYIHLVIIMFSILKRSHRKKIDITLVSNWESSNMKKMKDILKKKYSS